MRYDHSVCSGCVLSFVDDPWMVYPLTNAHLDVFATYLLLMKSTMAKYLQNVHKSFFFDSKFTNESNTMMETAIMIATLVTMK